MQRHNSGQSDELVLKLELESGEQLTVNQQSNGNEQSSEDEEDVVEDFMQLSDLEEYPTDNQSDVYHNKSKRQSEDGVCQDINNSIIKKEENLLDEQKDGKPIQVQTQQQRNHVNSKIEESEQQVKTNEATLQDQEDEDRDIFSSDQDPERHQLTSADETSKGGGDTSDANPAQPERNVRTPEIYMYEKVSDLSSRVSRVEQEELGRRRIPDTKERSRIDGEFELKERRKRRLQESEERYLERRWQYDSSHEGSHLIQQPWDKRIRQGRDQDRDRYSERYSEDEQYTRERLDYHGYKSRHAHDPRLDLRRRRDATAGYSSEKSHDELEQKRAAQHERQTHTFEPTLPTPVPPRHPPPPPPPQPHPPAELPSLPPPPPPPPPKQAPSTIQTQQVPNSMYTLFKQKQTPKLPISQEGKQMFMTWSGAMPSRLKHMLNVNSRSKVQYPGEDQVERIGLMRVVTRIIEEYQEGIFNVLYAKTPQLQCCYYQDLQQCVKSLQENQVWLDGRVVQFEKSAVAQQWDGHLFLLYVQHKNHDDLQVSHLESCATRMKNLNIGLTVKIDEVVSLLAVTPGSFLRIFGSHQQANSYRKLLDSLCLQSGSFYEKVVLCAVVVFTSDAQDYSSYSATYEIPVRTFQQVLR